MIYYIGVIIAIVVIAVASTALVRGLKLRDNVAELNEALQQAHMQLDQVAYQYEDWAKAHNEWAMVTRKDGPHEYSAERPQLRANAISELSQLIGQLERAKQAAIKARKEMRLRP